MKIIDNNIMNKDFVLNGNILIARFMNGMDEDIELRFHNSWDWLMPVVEKIESLGYFVKISTKMTAISRDNKNSRNSHLVKAEFGDETKLQKTYNCVISTIKYINYVKKQE